MIEILSDGLITTALPMLFTECSRLMRCRTTRTCFSVADSSFNCSENPSLIAGSVSTSGFISSRMRTRSDFFAHPGKGSFARFRANLTRLLITMGCQVPPDNQSPGLVRIASIFISIAVYLLPAAESHRADSQLFHNLPWKQHPPNVFAAH